ncbi:MAG: hypothetical protein AB8V04_03390 [Candidatus Midichloria sp.]
MVAQLHISNSVGNLAIAINHGNFANKYKIKPNFQVIVKPGSKN